MKQIISIVLLLVLSWQMVYKAGFIIYWKINQSAIASRYCENKAKPQMHCDGKCYLKKQLNNAGKDYQEKELPFSISQQTHIDSFIIENIFSHVVEFNLATYKQPSHNIGLLSTGHYNSLLQPPDLI